MSEMNTSNFDDGRTFEQRVFARFDALDSRVDSLESRVEKRFDTVDTAILSLNSRVERLEIRSDDTKPIWEQVLKEIVETRRELSRRLNRLESVTLENRADIREVEDRVEKLEKNKSD